MIHDVQNVVGHHVELVGARIIKFLRLAVASIVKGDNAATIFGQSLDP